MPISRMQMPRQLRRGGGIMNVAPRQGYFLGGVGDALKGAVKGVAKGIGSALKSDVGKLALLAGGAYFAPTLFGKAAGFGNFGSLLKGGLSKGIGKLAGEKTLGKTLGVMAGGTVLGGVLGSMSPEEQEEVSSGRNVSALRSKLTTAYQNLGYDESEIPALVDNDLSEYTLGAGGYADGGRIGYAGGSEDKFMELVERLREQGFSQQEAIEEARERLSKNMAYGGRIGYQDGSIMPRLNELGSSVSSAEQMLQEINQRLQSAESTLGEGGGMGGTTIAPNMSPLENAMRSQQPLGSYDQLRQMPIGQPGLASIANYTPFGGETVGIPEQFKSGFDEYKKENPIGIGGQAISYSMLPDGNRVSFGDTASAAGFSNYLKSIGAMPDNPFGPRPVAIQSPLEQLQSAGGPMQSPLQSALGLADGGRIGYAMGTDQIVNQASGIMGLPQRTNKAGVKELDLRESGGFIPPVGVKEKADDIPAMLSNNEFVFTADAVRGMGNGNVNKGAQRMYDMMKKLEKGGRV